MLAMVLEKPGESLRPVDLPTPLPAPGQVQVQRQLASIRVAVKEVSFDIKACVHAFLLSMPI